MCLPLADYAQIEQPHNAKIPICVCGGLLHGPTIKGMADYIKAILEQDGKSLAL